jgi:outer membrane immunogenic protein
MISGRGFFAMKRLLVSAAAIALMSSAALAADIPVYEPAPVVAPVPVGFDWSGFYTGAFGGYGWGDVEVSDLDGYNGEDFDYETDGFYFGTIVGYNLHWDWVLLGIEGELGRLEFEDDEQFPDYQGDPTREGDSIASVDIDTFGNVSGRLGLTWNNWLIYGKGGLAFADVEVEYEDPNPTGIQLITGTEEDDWLFGWTVGGGVEVGFWEKWSVRGEYMYTDLEDISHTATADSNDDGVGDTDYEFEHDLEDIHTVKLAVTRRF